MSNYTGGVTPSDPTFEKVTMTGPVVRHNGPSLTALAGGGQAGATLLTYAISKVGTVATAADSVILPPAIGGHERFVINATANSMNVFPATGEAINALSANTAFAVAAGKSCHFVCPVSGTWYTNLSA